MPRKVKQKQKQKQSQTVIVNVGTRRRASKGKQERRPPPPPQFVPYPVPSLRGPEPFIQPQPSMVPPPQSLVQQLEQLKALHQLIAPKPPAPTPTPTPAPVPQKIAEEKQEVGSPVLIQPDEPMVTPDEPLVSAKPAITPGQKMKIRPPRLAEPLPVPEELKPDIALPSRITREYLNGLNRDKPKASDPTAPTLLKVATQLGIRLGGANPPAGVRRRDSISKDDLIDLILNRVS